MNDMNPRAIIGGNAPPDPIDAITAAYEAARMEAENWLDGSPVENEGQMKAVDALRKDMREMRLALEAGQKSATAPLYDAYKAEGARWKPTIDDAKRIEAGLVAAVDAFKKRLAAEKAEAERRAYAEAEAKRRAAEEAARAANAADIEAQRAAAQALHDAEEARRAASAATADRKDAGKGTRTVTKYEITDHKDALHWIAKNDRDAVIAFVEEYARKHHKTAHIAGVRTWTEREAF